MSIHFSAQGITWQAFIDYVCSYTQLRDVESEYRDAFRIYDVSGCGMLSREDIKYVMGKLGIKCDVEELMNLVDTNRDGTIEYDGMFIPCSLWTYRFYYVLRTLSVIECMFFYFIKQGPK